MKVNVKALVENKTMMKKAILLGATGLLGRELKAAMETNLQLLAPNRQSLDVTDSKALRDYLQNEQPDTIINAVGLRGVKRCDADPELAHQLNTQLPEVLADYCNKHQTRLVHFSCANVYGPVSAAGDLIEENTATNPQSVYARTKLKGDLAIEQNCVNYLIFRLSGLYDRHVLTQLDERDPIIVGAPTTAFYVADTVARSLSRIERQVIRVHSGVYHLCTKGGADWHALNQEAASLKGSTGIFKVPVNDQSIPLAPSLSLAKVEGTFCLSIPEWRAQLRTTLSS